MLRRTEEFGRLHFEFRKLLVFRKLSLPLSLCLRRLHLSHQVPVNHRKPRFSQPDVNINSYEWYLHTSRTALFGKRCISFEQGLPGDAPQNNSPDHQAAAAQQPATYDAIRGCIWNGDCCPGGGSPCLCCDGALASPNEPLARLRILQRRFPKKWS